VSGSAESIRNNLPLPARADGGGQGTASGADMTFTTINIPPGLSTLPATDITTSSATLNGDLASLGTATTVNVSFEYGLTNQYGNTTTIQTVSAAGTFHTSLSDLSPGTTYHFRAKADGGIQGNTNGEDMTFYRGCYASGSKYGRCNGYYLR